MTRDLLPKLLVTLLAGAGTAAAQTEILVNSDISTSVTWTKNNRYNLQKQIYVLPGATLSIEAGTVIASTTSIGGSLAVCRGAQIFAIGNALEPIIFTSKADTATWTANNPKTGTWREVCNEWGNLTIMGRAYVSENAVSGNVPSPNAANVGAMEGLVAQSPGDPNVLYGGGNDDDNSGALAYCSFRYGGKVIALNNELNGLSLGGIGRQTDIHHIEIMNNVDDGIEIWGGTVNIKNFSIWNAGDDSLDIDQGWRGKAQFGLVVQGSSANAARGSGVSDNGFEMDGAEDSDWQPVTTATIYNVTFIGQPASGRGATAWRDNARVQFRNCIFMDTGIEAVRFDNLDGDGAHGYGFNGTLTWAQTWTTPYTSTSTVNAPANPAAFYRAQTSGNLAEIKDSVFWHNNNANAYTQANTVGVFNPANNNVQEPVNGPIKSITRGAPVVRGGLTVSPIAFLDPRPANDGLTSASWAPNDGFFESAHYRGGFAPESTWMHGWTAAEAFGFVPNDPWTDLGKSTTGTNGYPSQSGSGSLAPNTGVVISLQNAPAGAPGIWLLSNKRSDFPILGGTILPDLGGSSANATVSMATDGAGKHQLVFNWPAGVPSGTTLYMQYVILDAGGPFGLSFSNGLSCTAP